VEIPFQQTVEKVVEVPMIGETVQGTTTETQIPLETQRQEHPAQVVQQFHAGPDHPVEVQTVHIQTGQGQFVQEFVEQVPEQMEAVATTN